MRSIVRMLLAAAVGAAIVASASGVLTLTQRQVPTFDAGARATVASPPSARAAPDPQHDSAPDEPVTPVEPNPAALAAPPSALAAPPPPGGDSTSGGGRHQNGQRQDATTRVAQRVDAPQPAASEQPQAEQPQAAAPPAAQAQPQPERPETRRAQPEPGEPKPRRRHHEPEPSATTTPPDNARDRPHTEPRESEDPPYVLLEVVTDTVDETCRLLPIVGTIC